MDVVPAILDLIKPVGETNKQAVNGNIFEETQGTWDPTGKALNQSWPIRENIQADEVEL